MKPAACSVQDVEAEARAAAAARKRVEDIAAGRVRMNGRELYQHAKFQTLLDFSICFALSLVPLLDNYANRGTPCTAFASKKTEETHMIFLMQSLPCLHL
jgi:hypothetical protein